MKKIKYIVFVSILALLTACNSSDFEEHEIGSDLIDQSTEVLMIDTFTVESSTIKLDSVITSGYNDVLLGKYKDPYLGNVKAGFYGEVALDDAFVLESYSDEKVYVAFDSLVFIMYHDTDQTRYIGDTLPEQTVSLHRVTEEFDLPDNKYSYKGFDELTYDAEALGSVTFEPRLVLNGYINPIYDEDAEADRGGVRIRLDDALGQDIIDMVNDADDIVNVSGDWLDYFKGIYLEPGDNNTAMFSFQTAEGMKMRLYYHDKKYSEAGVLRYYDFPVTNNSLNFSNYSSDFISDKLSSVQKINDIEELEDDLSSEETGNLSFIQGGTGLMTKIRIPHIANLNLIGLTGGVLKAELVFTPEEDSFDDDIYPLPTSSFELYKTNRYNTLLSSVYNSSTGAQLYSTFDKDSEDMDQDRYSFDLTSYVNDILINGQDYDNALIITLPEGTLGNSMERLIINHDPNSDMRIKLEVTYVVQND